MDLQPIIPFEPISVDEVMNKEHWIAQVKWDGVRILTFWDGAEIKLYNRKKNERTHHFPELHNIHEYCSCSSVILDGEMIALGEDGKPSFHEVMRRDGIRSKEKVAAIQKIVPISYMVFDILYINGEWITDWILEKRLDALNQYIRSNDYVQLVPSFSDGEKLYEIVEEQALEGIVLKDLRSKYAINGKDKRWQKKKNYLDVIAIVGGVTLRSGIVNSLLVGLKEEDGSIRYIGHVGTGKLKKNEWRELTEKVQPFIQSKSPFCNKTGREKEAIWLNPIIQVKVQFMEWTAGGHLRQPSIQAFIKDVK